MTGGAVRGPLPVCVGWQFAPVAGEPGPAPSRPVASEPAVRLDRGWIQAQRAIHRKLARPARLGAGGSVLVCVLLTLAWLIGLVGSALACGCGVAVAFGGLSCARSLRRGRHRLDAAISAERQRVAALSAARGRRLAEDHREHASGYRAWQRRLAVYQRQPCWFPVRLPAQAGRLDLAGGTLAGWSALLTTIAATHLSSGGEVTVVDLTEGAVAGDLIRLARQSGIWPLVWVLPADLPRLDLGTGFSPPVLADVLALAAGTGGESGTTADHGGQYAADCALLERVLGALRPAQRIAQVNAALRALGEIGDPRADVRAGLITTAQLDRVGALFGRGGAERVVIERAWTLESRLRHLESLGADQVPLAPSRLRVAAVDRRSGAIGNRTLGTYLVAALTQVLREAEPGRPWQHTLCLFGAERLAGEVIDRLSDVCEVCGAGLVLGYRSIQGVARERLGRGAAAIAFMRLGNGEDARLASELIGTEHRFVVGQITDTIGTSLTDTWGDSYTSTVGTADSVADTTSLSRGSGGSISRSRSYQGAFAPFGAVSRSSAGDRNYSISHQGSVSLTAGINAGTSWGVSLSRALGENASLGRTAQRSREFLVEPDELQRLPATAAIISYPAAAGRTVLLADTNPAITGLPAAAMASAADDHGERGQDSGTAGVFGAAAGAFGAAAVRHMPDP